MKPTRIYGSNDPFILRAVTERPEWLRKKVHDRLDGYPSVESCWEWTGSVNNMGYGRVALPSSVKTVAVYVHRVMWLATNGPIPTRHVIDHGGDGCGNILCANPAHLSAVTQRVNTVVTAAGSATAVSAAKTHCPQGHPLTDGNIRPSFARRGYRACQTCSLEGSRRKAALVADAMAALGISQRELRRLYGGSRATLERIISEAS